ncbi:MAG: hypothetical protein GX329_05190 [Tissierellia bacterium]|nr:hypothetical protein [Tissierellia bacterium]
MSKNTDISTEQLFEFMTKMYAEMQEGFSKMRQGFKEVEEIKNRVITIEQDHGKKLDILLDGYKQNAERLDRIEEEVSKHEEIILRRIK